MNLPDQKTVPNASEAGHFWVFPDAQTRWLWKDLARHVTRVSGLHPLFVVNTAADRNFYEAQFGEELVGDIVVRDDHYAFVVKGGDPSVPDSELIERALRYERENGISLLREIVLADRHLGRGYALGGTGHPTSNISDRASPRAILEACLMATDHCEHLAERYPPALVFGGGAGGLWEKPAALLSRRLGIPFRTLVSARLGNLHYWAEDEFEGCPDLEEFVASFPEPSEEEIRATPARVVPNTRAGPAMVRLAMGELEWSTILYQSGYRIARKIYARLRGYSHGRIGYHEASLFAQSMRARADWKRLGRIAAKDLDGLDDRKLVYFPLQQVPEASTLLLTPYHTNQLAIVLELALSLPANALLVVKEHLWQLGRRPREFYDQLLGMPNVVLVHPSFSSLEIIRKSSLVCSISSSAAHEAAVLGRPVIYFHKGTALGVLAHVHVLGSQTELDCVRDILSDESPEAQKHRERDGARYLLALEHFCLEFSGETPVLRQRRPNQDEMTLLCERLPLSPAGKHDRPMIAPRETIAQAGIAND